MGLASAGNQKGYLTLSATIIKNKVKYVIMSSFISELNHAIIKLCNKITKYIAYNISAAPVRPYPQSAIK